MPRLFFGNFDFEHQLATPGRSSGSAVLRKINAELACVWFSIAEPGDAIWTPEPIDSSFVRGLADIGLSGCRTVGPAGSVGDALEFTPWGWSATALAWARKRRLDCSAPPAAAVHEANCRLFSIGLETEWGIGLEGSAVVRSPADLARAVQAASDRGLQWVLKARFGMSARERILGRGSGSSPAVLNWLGPRLARDGAVVFEPWVEKIAEAGIQISVPPAGAPQLLGLTPLLTDHVGAYRGNRFGPAADDRPGWADAVDVCLRAASRIQSLGYFGPVGIDAMRYRDAAGQVRMRPLQDINARNTMGRLSLGLRRLLGPGEAGVWLHFRRTLSLGRSDESVWKQAEQSLPAGVRLLITSPEQIGGQPAERGSAVLISDNERALAEAEQHFLRPWTP